MRLLISIALATCLYGQTAPSITLEKQRVSVRKQVRADGPASGFFTTPWMDSGNRNPAIETAATGDCEALPQDSLEKLILEHAQKQNVSPRLVRALIRRESGGKPCAVSAKGAQGLMQIMPAAQVDMGVQDPFDPADNIAGGVKYLKQMLDRYNGNTALALAAYNAGPQRVAVEGGRIPDIAETQNYVFAILADLNEEPQEAAVK